MKLITGFLRDRYGYVFANDRKGGGGKKFAQQNEFLPYNPFHSAS